MSPSGGTDAAGARWLVTGADGQLGRSLLAVAAPAGIDAVGLDLPDLDVSDSGAVARALKDVRPDVVVNCAGFTQVDLCEERIEEARRVNAEAPGILAAACRERALLLHLSTEYVFGGDAHRPLDEQAPTRPLSVYGRTKWEGEEAVREVGGAHLVVRTQWLFGPGGNFVRTIQSAAARGEALRVVEDQIGRPTWTGALARALVEAVHRGARGTLHVACEGLSSWFDLAVAVVEHEVEIGRIERVDVEPIASGQLTRPAPRPAYAVLDLGRARALGIRLPHWRVALRRYLQAEQEGRDA